MNINYKLERRIVVPASCGCCSDWEWIDEVYETEKDAREDIEDSYTTDYRLYKKNSDGQWEQIEESE